MIPKIIHYVWVGNATKSDLILKCIASWKKYCPDYEIKEWGNDSLSQISNKYVWQAFKNRKWAFVSDYLRLYALEKFGGFYFDSDLEITQKIDKFLNNKFITGHEIFNNVVLPFTAFVGSEPHGRIIKTLLSEYDDIDFERADGTFDQMTNTLRVSNLFNRNYGVSSPYDGVKQLKLADDGIIEPWWFFCTPRDGYENYAIHHFNGSWIDRYSRKPLFKIGHFKLVKFKQKAKETTEKFPLMEKEQILASIKISKKKTICLIKKEK